MFCVFLIQQREGNSAPYSTSQLSCCLCLLPVYPFVVWRTVFKTPLSICASKLWCPVTHNDPCSLVSVMDYSRKCAQSHLSQQIPPNLCGLYGCTASITHHCQPEPLQPVCPSLWLTHRCYYLTPGSSCFLPPLQNLLGGVLCLTWLECGLCNGVHYSVSNSVSSLASYLVSISTVSE